ncbi:hemerythrin domain-containing protein [Paraburkholderia rhynchosiae]|uniref:Hemerythrin n=1 Tax=Paraburkholderia rhynchosiae TaxID=487049 RepID=A0A2N7WC17_9BURK|nr:hemerythrin domain-containing protein [Paraburkholderia rhynchosiae]PMS26949.1 hemerythrin [Paraburkholderia rhynchosiae]CAB3727398.1 Bacteriohemerythrin [Paraburkholderia rhynchosiae]
MSSQQTALAWNDAFLLGYGPMDDTHREFIDCIDAALGASDGEFVIALHALVEHLEQHFSSEKEWMELTEFPAADCHIAEHDAVRRSAHEVVGRLNNGRDVQLGRSFARELARWFPSHADYMDAALAQWIVKRTCGGVPVVVRRNVVFD